jgi:hypothetical protein
MTTNEYRLSEDQEKWVRARAARYRLPRELLRNIIREQRGCCAWSGVSMRFDTPSLTPPEGRWGQVFPCHFFHDTTPLFCIRGNPEDGSAL